MTRPDQTSFKERIILPFPPEDDVASSDKMDIYARFMRHLRCVANSREDIRVLSAIQFVADMMDRDDAEIASVLVELGLRAPRMAFPERYLDFIDRCYLRATYRAMDATGAVDHLRFFWSEIGEDQLAPFKRDVSVVDTGYFAGLYVD